MNKTPLLTVLTPCRNQFPELRQTVESVWAQNASDLLHLIVVSHGSVESAPVAVKSLDASSFPRLFYEDIDGGPEAAVNIVLSHTIGRFLVLLGAGDLLLPGCVDDGSPYYVFNYDDETGRSDSVTGGKGIHKTVLVYRYVKPEYCDSPRLQKMLALAREIESLCGWIPLDIEFALDKQGATHLLQVRRISTAGGWHPDSEHRMSRIIPYAERFVGELSARKKGILGKFTILGNMPDWNPAELIGAVPSLLAV